MFNLPAFPFDICDWSKHTDMVACYSMGSVVWFLLMIDSRVKAGSVCDWLWDSDAKVFKHTARWGCIISFSTRWKTTRRPAFSEFPSSIWPSRVLSWPEEDTQCKTMSHLYALSGLRQLKYCFIFPKYMFLSDTHNMQWSCMYKLLFHLSIIFTVIITSFTYFVAVDNIIIQWLNSNSGI